MSVARTIEDLTAPWLGAILDTDVSDLSTERIGTGQTAQTHLVSFRSDGEARTLVAKLAAGDSAARAMVAPGYRNEVGFYQHVAGTVAVHTPHCHHAAITDDGQDFTLLLDDLSPRRPGVQADGCGPAVAGAALDNLAGLHAPRWNDGSLNDLEFISGPSPEGAEFLGEIARTATEQFTARFAESLGDDEIAALHDAADAVAAWTLARLEPFAPIHGDYRLDNLMFGDDDVVAVDWQTLAVGPPLRDVGYFLATSLHVEDRRTSEHELVAGYHAALIRRGVEGYDVTRCFEDYRIGVLQAPMITTMGCILSPAERTRAADDMFLSMARRAAAAIRDLDPFELL